MCIATVVCGRDIFVGIACDVDEDLSGSLRSYHKPSPCNRTIPHESRISRYQLCADVASNNWIRRCSNGITLEYCHKIGRGLAKANGVPEMIFIHSLSSPFGYML